MNCFERNRQYLKLYPGVNMQEANADHEEEVRCAKT